MQGETCCALRRIIAWGSHRPFLASVLPTLGQFERRYIAHDRPMALTG